MGESDAVWQRGGVTRRDVLRRGAVAGAIVWATPVLTSRPAAAAPGTPIDINSFLPVRMSRTRTEYLFDPPPSDAGAPADTPIVPDPTPPTDRPTSTTQRPTSTTRPRPEPPTTSTRPPATTTTLPPTTTVPLVTTTSAAAAMPRPAPSSTPAPTTAPTPTTFDLDPAARIRAAERAELPVTTTLPEDPLALTAEFGPDDISVQWYRPCPDISQWIVDHPRAEYDRPRTDQWPVLTQSLDTAAWVVNIPKGPLPDGALDCRFVIGCGLAGRLSSLGYVDPEPPDPTERATRIIFEQPNPEQPMHAIQIVYGCPT